MRKVSCVWQNISPDFKTVQQCCSFWLENDNDVYDLGQFYQSQGQLSSEIIPRGITLYMKLR